MPLIGRQKNQEQCENSLNCNKSKMQTGVQMEGKLHC